MIFNLNNRINDTSSLRPQETTPVTPRQKAVATPAAPLKPTDQTPSSMGLFASMLNGVANIGRTVQGVVTQNNAAIANREYDKMSIEFDQRVALLQNESMETFPDKFDEILADFNNRIDGLGFGKTITGQIKAMLIDNSEDRAYSLFSNAITDNRNQLVTSYNTGITDAIELKDRSKAYRIIYDNMVGEGAVFDKTSAAQEVIRVNKAIDQQIVKSDLWKRDINESFDMLNDQNTKYLVEPSKPVLDKNGKPVIEGQTPVGYESAGQYNNQLAEPLLDGDGKQIFKDGRPFYKNNTAEGSPQEAGIQYQRDGNGNVLMEGGTPLMTEARYITLTVDQASALRSQLSDDDYKKRTINSLEYGDGFESTLAMVYENKTYDEYKIAVKSGEVPGVTVNNMRDSWEKANGIYQSVATEEQNRVFAVFEDMVIQNQDAQLNVKNPEFLKAELQKIKYSMGSENYSKAAGLLGIPVGSTVDPADELSDSIANEMIGNMITGKTDPQLTRVLASNAVDSDDMNKDGWGEVASYYKYFEDKDIKKFITELDTDKKLFEDKDGNLDTAKYNKAVSAIRQVVSESYESSSPMNVAQLNDRYTSILEILTKKDVLKELDQTESNVRRLGWSKFEGDTDRSVQRLVSGDFSALKILDPDRYETFVNYLDEQAKIIGKKDFPGEDLPERTRLHEGYMPVYTIDAKEYIMDIGYGGNGIVLTPLKEAMDKYKNLAYGKPIGFVFEDTILTYDGYKRMEDLYPVNIHESEGYMIKDQNGDPDYNKPSYVMAIDGATNETVFSPIYSPLSDVASVIKELESITELPMSQDRLDELGLKTMAEERYNELFQNAGRK